MTPRKIKYTPKFKRDYKREEKSGRYRTTLDHDLVAIIHSLAENVQLANCNRDHLLWT